MKYSITLRRDKAFAYSITRTRCPSWTNDSIYLIMLGWDREDRIAFYRERGETRLTSFSSRSFSSYEYCEIGRWYTLRTT